MQIADRCRLEPAQLRARLSQLRRGERGAAARAKPAPPPARPLPVSGLPERPSPELEALRLAVHRPEEVAPYLEEVLFSEELHRRAFAALAGAATLQDAVDDADPEVADLLRRLAVEEEAPDAGDVIALVVRRATLRALADLEAEARASQTVIDLTWPKGRLEELDAPQSRVQAAGQLVAWLSRSGEVGA
jgi:hypothetical protein